MCYNKNIHNAIKEMITNKNPNIVFNFHIILVDLAIVKPFESKKT